MQYEFQVHNNQPVGQCYATGGIQNLLSEKMGDYPAAGVDRLLLHIKYCYGMCLGLWKRIEDEQYGDRAFSCRSVIEKKHY